MSIMPGFSYNAEQSPLEMPFVELAYACVAEIPFTLHHVSGKTPGTTLGGALFDALEHHDASVAQALMKAAPRFEPGRKFTPRAVINAPGLWTHRETRDFSLHVRLFGREAVRNLDVVEKAIAHMGKVGLDIGGQGGVTFSVGQKRFVKQGTPMTFASTLNGAASIFLSFVTPVLIRDTVPSDTGGKLRLFQAGGEVALDALLGNLAYDMCYLDLHERGIHDISLYDAGQLGNRARKAASDSAARILVEGIDQVSKDYGIRPSKTQAGKYEMRGFTARLRLTGELTPALPWLVALTAWRAAQSASKGFGWAEIENGS